jgi:hypothetical protein
MSDMKHTPGPWFVSGVRFRMNGGEWHNVMRYNEATKKDEHVACIGYDPRTGEGFADAHFIAAAPDMYEALKGFNIGEADIVGATATHLIIRLPMKVITSAAAAIAKAEGRQP